MSPGEADRAADAAMAGIWVRNRGAILLGVSALEHAATDGLAGRLDDVQRARARDHAHRLAGSAGTFGFPAAGVIARTLEQALSGESPPSRSTCPSLVELAAALRRELGGAPAA